MKSTDTSCNLIWSLRRILLQGLRVRQNEHRFAQSTAVQRLCHFPHRHKHPPTVAKHTVTCIPVARQWLGKWIPATHVHATIECPLLCNGSVNTFPLKRVTIGSPLLSNGAVTKLRQPYRLLSVGSMQGGYKRSKF
jgi:hypothetical protein